MKQNKTIAILMVVLVLGLGLVSFTSAQSTGTTFEQYVVQPGDTLSKIAAKYCTTWQEVYYYNAGTIGSDPNAIEAGMVLYIPDRCSDSGEGSDPSVYDRGPRLGANGTVVGNVYYAAAGDNLFAVAQRFGVRLDVLQQVNGITDPNKLEPGQAIVIPGLSTTPPPQPPPSNITTKTFAQGECTLTPLTGAPAYSYPDGPQVNTFPGGVQYPAVQGVKTELGTYWYSLQASPGTSNPLLWVQDRDTATAGNCRW